MSIPNSTNEKVTFYLSLILLFSLILPWYTLSNATFYNGSIDKSEIDFNFFEVLGTAKWNLKLIYFLIPANTLILLFGTWKNNGIFKVGPYLLQRNYLTIPIIVALVLYQIDNQNISNSKGDLFTLNMFRLGYDVAVGSALLLQFNKLSNNLYLKLFKK